jgi:BirA family transcriptional regulator, biotin operon repressor / biotin---[acetyl-CoA-carboxylase] ligase
MDEQRLKSTLSSLPLGPVRYFDQIDSTNSEAARWLEAGAPDRSLVIANEQTSGRGRMGRRWHTPAGASLALSLLLRPKRSSRTASDLIRYTALGALAVCEALEEKGLTPEIKWPNDVIIAGRKLAGILVEIIWQAEALNALIIGIGVNVSQHSLPEKAALNFPATWIEAETGNSVNRIEFLHTILASLLGWLDHLDSSDFLEAWQRSLAYRGEWVEGMTADGQEVRGIVAGLTEEGFLRLRGHSGEVFTIKTGEISLRPAGEAGSISS